MKVLVLNGSPRKKGTVATLLRAVAEGAAERNEIEWINVYDLSIHPCLGCMKCWPGHDCVLPQDDAQAIAHKVSEARGLVVGTPTYWANMSGQLKLLFDRIVPAFVTENGSGMPVPRHRGKPAVVVTSCTTPWPLDLLMGQSRGSLRAVREVLRYAGFDLVGQLVKPGTKAHPEMPEGLLRKARRLGRKL